MGSVFTAVCEDVCEIKPLFVAFRAPVHARRTACIMAISVQGEGARDLAGNYGKGEMYVSKQSLGFISPAGERFRRGVMMYTVIF